MKNFLSKDITELPAAARGILQACSAPQTIAFYGEMGAGKTTLIKAICTELGVKNSTSSPTFSLVNEYLSEKGEKIYHFDFYRLKNEAEAYDMGYEEYFYSGAWCFIEWPEKIKGLLPEGCLKVNISVSGDKREIRIT